MNRTQERNLRKIICKYYKNDFQAAALFTGVLTAFIALGVAGILGRNDPEIQAACYFGMILCIIGLPLVWHFFDNKVGPALSIIEDILEHRDQFEISPEGEDLQFTTKDRRLRYTIERELFDAAKQVYSNETGLPST